MKTTLPPGVFDILPEDPQATWKSSYIWDYVRTVIRDTAEHFGYREICTPMFERTELFQRGIGETSDIVTKEMYTFEDKSGRSMTLRPEGTAPVMRAFMEHHLDQRASVHKLFYICPMFRYERAQAGRYRQHHQFGAEAIGNTSPQQDVELIDLLYTVFSRLGLRNLRILLNSIGDLDSRKAYRKALTTYLKKYESALSEDSQKRLKTNPLRILDSKNPQDIEIVAEAPSILNSLNEESRTHFEEVKRLLDALYIPYEVTPTLVRGLDYYTKTVFEIQSGELGAQNSIGGGGRYDGLLKTLGGPDLPAIGFGSGIERIIQTLLKQEVFLPKKPAPILFMIPLGEKANEAAFSMLHALRLDGIPTEMDFSGRKLGKMMQYANQIGATYVTVIGDEELKTQTLELKVMSTGEKLTVPMRRLGRILQIEMQSDAFIDIWNDMNTPFQDASEMDFFVGRIKKNIDSTHKVTEELKSALEVMKEILA